MSPTHGRCSFAILARPLLLRLALMLSALLMNARAGACAEEPGKPEVENPSTPQNESNLPAIADFELLTAEIELLPPGESIFQQSLDEPIDPMFAPPGMPVLSEPPEEVLSPVPPPAKPAPKIWSGRFELGFNGSEGNSQQFSSDVAGKLKRKTKVSILNLALNYNSTSADSKRIQNQMLFDGRFERLLHNTPLTYFIHATVDFDQFTAYDWRLTSDAGLGLFLINNDTTEFQIRGGAGFSREFGIPDPEYVPEASYGLALDHQLTVKQKLSASGDFFPQITRFDHYRARFEAAWEIIIDDDEHLSLRFSVLDKYDSTPDGNQRNLDKRPNDITYAGQVVFSF